jgi:hypothetical protein
VRTGTDVLRGRNLLHAGRRQQPLQPACRKSRRDARGRNTTP